jgi:hypothetical protein
VYLGFFWHDVFIVSFYAIRLGKNAWQHSVYIDVFIISVVWHFFLQSRIYL